MKKKNMNENEWVKWFWKWYIISLFFIALFFAALSVGWLGFMPSFEELENPYPGKSTRYQLLLIKK